MKDLKNTFTVATRIFDNKKVKLIFTKMRRVFMKNVWLTRILLAVVVLLALIATGSLVGKMVLGTKVGNYLSLAKDFAFSPSTRLKSIDGKVNFIILGKGGKGHEAPELTDTIMVASLDITKGKVAMVSLPRDIWIPQLRAKLNSAYYWGNQKQPGGGIVLAKSTIESLVGQPIAYAIVVDFSGFEKIIDAVGGIDIYVDRSFVDEKYPIAGRENDLCDGDKEYKCRYERLEFNQGWQKMDGLTALKYSRSRQAEGDEGTDFARAQRQQKVLTGLKTKITSSEVVLSPAKLISLYEATMESIETDLTSSELMILARLLFKAKDTLNTQVLPEKYLINPPVSAKYDYQYVFVPVDGGWKEFQVWFNSLLD